jgi:ribonuclease HI
MLSGDVRPLFARVGQKAFSMIPSSTTKSVAAYIDGADFRTHDERIGGWSAVMMLVDANGVRDPRPMAYKEISGSIQGATHNQAALQAVKQVLLALKQDGVSLTIYTGRKPLVGVLAQQWKPSRNQELIAEIKNLMKKHQVTFCAIDPSEDDLAARANLLALTAAD